MKTTCKSGILVRHSYRTMCATEPQSSYLWAGICVVLISVALPGTLAADAESFSELRATISAESEIRAQTLLSRTFRVRYTADAKVEQLPPAIVSGEYIRSGENEYIAEGDKVYLRSIVNESPYHGGWIHEESWDGARYKKLEIDHEMGEIDLDLGEAGGAYSGRLRFQASPFQFTLVEEELGNKLTPRLAELMSIPELGGFREQREMVGNTACLVYEVEGVPTIWFDESLGYAVKKYRIGVSGEGVTAKEYINDEFQEITPGYWLPLVSRTVWVGPGPAGDEIVLFETTYEFDQIAINVDFDDQVFDLQFPPNTYVNDARVGIGYRVNETQLADMLSTSIEALESDIEQAGILSSAKSTNTQAGSSAIDSEEGGREASISGVTLALALLGAGLLFGILAQVRSRFVRR